MERSKYSILNADPKPWEQEQTQVLEDADTLTVHIPKYHVILLDDDHHTYDYVVEMLMKVFGHSPEQAFDMACTVDSDGFVVVDTTHKDRAELKRDQVHDYGPDWRIANCSGSMSAFVEPAERLDG